MPQFIHTHTPSKASPNPLGQMWRRHSKAEDSALRCGADTRVCRVPTPGDAWRSLHRALVFTPTLLSRFLFAIAIWAACSPLVFSQVCRTVNSGTPSARCAQTGAACSIGGGVSGRCEFMNADRVCDCQANSSGTPPPPSGPTAIVSKVLSNPIFINLYWDSSWDDDNPSMPRKEMDAFTAAMLKSSYFGGLSEYGVKSASFGGSFLPDPNCDRKAPSSVEFYAPFGTSITGFLNCELDHVPGGDQVVYNIILPKGSIESDLFGASSFCTGSGGKNAWHFHQNPYSALGIAAQVLGAATGGSAGALAGARRRYGRGSRRANLYHYLRGPQLQRSHS